MKDLLRKVASFIFMRLCVIAFAFFTLVGGLISPKMMMEQIIRAIEEQGWHHHWRV